VESRGTGRRRRNAISFFASAALMAKIHAPPADRQRSTMCADLAEG
jgi:hypothetical protein